MAHVFGHPTAGGGPGLAACPVLPADLTGLPGAAICGRGGLSRPPRLIEPGFLLRPPARLPAVARPPPGPRLCLKGCLTQASPSQVSAAVGRGLPVHTRGTPSRTLAPCPPPRPKPRLSPAWRMSAQRAQACGLHGELATDTHQGDTWDDGAVPATAATLLWPSHKPAGLPSRDHHWSRVLAARRIPLAGVVVRLSCPSPVLPGWRGPTGGLQLSPLTGHFGPTVPFRGLTCSSGMGTGRLSCLEAGGGSGTGLGMAGSQRAAGHSGPPGPGPRGCGRVASAGMCQGLAGSAPAPGSGLLSHTHLTDEETEAWCGAAASQTRDGNRECPQPSCPPLGPALGLPRPPPLLPVWVALCLFIYLFIISLSLCVTFDFLTVFFHYGRRWTQPIRSVPGGGTKGPPSA